MPQSTTLGLHPVIHVPNYMDYYSYTDPWGINGWVGHVGWPTAEVWPTKWSSVQLAVWCRTGKVRWPRPALYPLFYAAKVVTTLFKKFRINNKTLSRFYHHQVCDICLQASLSSAALIHCIIACFSSHPAASAIIFFLSTVSTSCILCDHISTHTQVQIQDPHLTLHISQMLRSTRNTHIIGNQNWIHARTNNLTITFICYFLHVTSTKLQFQNITVLFSWFTDRTHSKSFAPIFAHTKHCLCYILHCVIRIVFHSWISVTSSNVSPTAV